MAAARPPPLLLDRPQAHEAGPPPRRDPPLPEGGPDLRLRRALGQGQDEGVVGHAVHAVRDPHFKQGPALPVAQAEGAHGAPPGYQAGRQGRAQGLQRAGVDAQRARVVAVDGVGAGVDEADRVGGEAGPGQGPGGRQAGRAGADDEDEGRRRGHGVREMR